MELLAARKLVERNQNRQLDLLEAIFLMQLARVADNLRLLLVVEDNREELVLKSPRSSDVPLSVLWVT